MGTKRDNKVGIERDDKMSIKRDNKAGTTQDDNRLDDFNQDYIRVEEPAVRSCPERDDSGVNDTGQDDRGALKLVVGACIEIRRLLYCTFFLTTYSNTFLTFSSLEAVIA